MSADYRDGTVVLDRDGDAWQLHDGEWHCAVALDDVVAPGPVDGARLAEQLGPLRVIHAPEEERT